MFVPVHYYNRVVPWYLQHRGEFSVLVHPNTGCEYEGALALTDFCLVHIGPTPYMMYNTHLLLISIIYSDNFLFWSFVTDHSDWAQWTGDKWNMDMSIFTPNTQTESFNQTLGTPENPACLANEGDMCAAGDASSLGFAPQVVCCAGMSCNCRDGSGYCYCGK